jgi:hypothetical protein
MPLPGVPATGGNNPAVVAAMQRQRAGTMSAGADPNQMPNAAGPGGAGGTGVGHHLAQALKLYVAGGANPGDTEQIRQFFEAFVRIAAETKQQVGSQAAPAGGPQMGAGMAQAAPMPGR